MKKTALIIIAIVLIFTVNAFGQTQRKKRVLHNLPEVDDEVLAAFRKKNLKHKTSTRRKSAKRKVKPFFDEADAIFGKTNKHKQVRKRKRVLFKF